MVNPENHENEQLANRLTAAADGITNAAAAGLEHDLRTAAALIRGDTTERTTPLIPWLMSELAKIANYTTDTDTQRRLRRLLGEARQ